MNARPVSRSWYANSVLRADKDVVDEFNIGFYHPDRSTTGEFVVRFVRLGGSVTPRLEAFADGWHALLCMPEFLALLGVLGKRGMSETEGWRDLISPDDFRQHLLDLGFADRTNTTPD